MASSSILMKLVHLGIPEYERIASYHWQKKSKVLCLANG